MIHPLLPYSVKGAIWYQGESNRTDGFLYFEKMKALIAGWRSVWNNKKMPFYYVQLAPFRYGGDTTLLAQIWHAQSKTLTVPNTGMAVINDIGNVINIHPRNKLDVGSRLALWALAKDYGRKGLVYSGPLYDSLAVEGSKIRLSFKHVGGGLVSRDGKPLNWFAIAGSDKAFYEAKAEIDGDNVLVSSKAVTNPVAVRFAWHQEAEPNLMNKEGLPASSFRTDDWEIKPVEQK
jgi:sialate O-acetylesterase